MVLFLINFVFSVLGYILELAVFVIFRGLAAVVVLVIQSLRATGLGFNSVLESIAGLLRGGAEYLLELLWDAIVTIVKNVFEVLVGTATGSVNLTTSAVVELAEKTKAGLEMLAEVFPEMFADSSEMVGKVILDLWNNYKDAIGYIIENLR